MEGARIRRLAEQDVDRAIVLTDLEEWGYTRADFLRLLALSPDGCFAAEADGSLAGLLSTTEYGPIAFLGAVIVSPELRGKGLGDAMMRAALDYLDGRGVETVVLNAYMNVVPFYERLGFRGEYENVRWSGKPAAPHSIGASLLDAERIDQIVSFDARYFGVPRTALLSRLAREFPETFLVAERADLIVGYLVGNTSGPSCEIGPWVVDPSWAEVASDLFDGLMRASSARTYAFTAPSPNHRASELSRQVGFAEVFRTLRMVRGKPVSASRPEGIYGLAGLEKG